MLIGYVSDERYVAIADVAVEFERDGESVGGGPFHAARRDLRRYRAGRSIASRLRKTASAPRASRCTVDPATPYQFRLLSDGLLGLRVAEVGAQPASGPSSASTRSSRTSSRSGATGCERSSSALLGWFDEHGPRAVMQITPDGDYTQTGVQWNKLGYGSPHHTQSSPGPSAPASTTSTPKRESGAFFSFPWVVAPAKPQRQIAVLASTITWNAYNNFGGRSNYINADRICRRRRPSTRGST